MYYNYSTTRTINILLFMIQSLGGRTEILRLFDLIYLADITHLAKYGSLISGDKYIPIQLGPIPFHTYLLYQKLKTYNKTISFDDNIYEYFALEGNVIIALQKYDSTYLSRSEVECLYKMISKYKATELELIMKDVVKTLKNTDYVHEIPLEDMLDTNEEVSKSFVSYVQYSNKIKDDYLPAGLKTEKDYISSILHSVNIGDVIKDFTTENVEYCFVITGMSSKDCSFVEILSNKRFPLVDFEDISYIESNKLSSAYPFIASDSFIDCAKLFTLGYERLSSKLKDRPDAILGTLNDEDIHMVIKTIMDSDTISLRDKDEHLPVYGSNINE